MGEAAHITAASPGGERRDDAMTTTQRSHISNGIWLCAACATLIDKDATAFPEDLLRSWKADHEAWVAAGGCVAAVPSVVIRPLGGFSFPPTGESDVTPEENEQGREFQLVVELSGRATITELELECQFPERLYRTWLHRQPVGVKVCFEPVPSDFVTIGARTTYGDMPPPKKWRLAIGDLRPQQMIDLRFRSLFDEEPPFAGRRLDWMSTSTGEQYWLHGHYRWEYRGAPKRREFTVVLAYDPATRQLTSAAPTTEYVRRVIVTSFP